MNRSITYLYGLARPGTQVPASLTGIDDDRPVRVLEIASLGAVVSEVAPEPFASEAPTDPAWLVPRALRHERVIETLHRRGPVLPVRFGALFTSRTALEAFAAENRGSIEAFLDHVVDKDEWIIKLRVELGSALESLAELDPAWAARVQALSPSPGTRYFQEKRLHEDARRQVRSAARTAAARVRAVACILAEERLFVPRPADRADVLPVLHAAYLVPRLALPEFEDRIRQAVGDLPCLHRESSGPWPPSHFCPPVAEPRR